MSNKLIKRPPAQSLVPSGDEWSTYKEIASIWSQAPGMLPAHLNTPEKVLATMLAARDLGLKTTAAFKGLYVTNGKIQMDGWAALALVQAKLKGFDYEIIKNDNEEAEIKGRRSPQHSWATGYFSIKLAAQAGLTDKDVWRKHTADMIFSKALLRMLRRVASDVLMGLVYDEEEMELIGSPSPVQVDKQAVEENVIDVPEILSNFEEEAHEPIKE